MKSDYLKTLNCCFYLVLTNLISDYLLVMILFRINNHFQIVFYTRFRALDILGLPRVNKLTNEGSI